MDRAEEPWMHDLMVACGELEGELVLRHREKAPLHSSASPSRAPAETHSSMHSAASGATAVVVIEEPENSGVSAKSHSEDQRKAVAWFASVKDEGVVQSLVSSLPNLVLQDIESQYRNGSCDQKVAVAAHRKMTWPLKNLVGQNKMSERFDSYLKEHDISSGHRLPRHCVSKFLEQNCILPKRCKEPGTKLRRWHARWEKTTMDKPCPTTARTPSKLRTKRTGQLQRTRGNQGRRTKMPWVREALYEWFIGMRYAIDWKA
jgi:hypothetical protein